MLLFVVGLVGFVSSAFSEETAPDIRIWEDTRDGQPVVIMENALYRTVFAYTQARLPLSYLFKVTGHEEFVMPEKLNDDHEHFHYFGGIIDSVPSTSGADPEDRKGQLWRVPWKIKLVQHPTSAEFHGKATFSYDDPRTDVKATLAFEKVIVGYAGSSVLEMRYKITNIGEKNARFMLTAHSRMGVGGAADEGDYFYAPGDSCRLYYTNWPSVLKPGVEPPCWIKWPVKEATDWLRTDKNYHIFVYLPSDWSGVGDEKFKESVFFVSSPIRLGKKTRQMRMGMFMVSSAPDYVMEPSLTYYGGEKGWDAPDGTVTLKPGEVCSFTLNMTAYQGVSRKTIEGLKEVRPNLLVLEPLKVRTEGDDLILSGRIAVAGSGTLTVTAENKVFLEEKLEAGIVDLGRTIRGKRGMKGVSVKFRDSLGTVTLNSK